MRALVQLQLADMGFKKRTEDIFTRDLSSDVSGWIGLNRAIRRRAKILEINPVVGVRHQPTERLVAELQGIKFHPYVPPTLSVHLGYLTPEQAYKPWLFPETADPEPIAARMVHEILEFGVPFMQDNSSLERIVLTINESGYGIPEQHHYRLPVAYYLLGRTRTADEYMARRLREIGMRDDLASRDYQCFVETLRQRMREPNL
jgi:hypothetical protein